MINSLQCLNNRLIHTINSRMIESGALLPQILSKMYRLRGIAERGVIDITEISL